ncbi:hypothetical protein [Mongoliibacter ruber]|uniref:Uncharacterized protein n=1 Tax=Mongoliibacter ruber TaxID=1750599 RepID=A0A2T0WV76_9BACT|nr:hypothetical protein [Mongoliibacter ruber]PRY90596.1 hypothetical protein CLW00_101260 [Mongoliibacter ruber]
MNKDQLLKVIESTIVSISASIPIAATFATGYTEYRNSLQERNVKEIIYTLFKSLKSLEERVDKEYLKSGDFKSLTMKVCLHGMDEIHEEKRKYLSYFLANSCVVENSKDLIKNSVLETLMRLSKFDLIVLNVLFEGVKGDFGEVIRGKKKFDLNFAFLIFEESYVTGLLPQYNELDIRITLHYLESIGVIENAISRTFNRNFSIDIDDYLRSKRLDEIMNRILELQSSLMTTNKKIELRELEKEQKELVGFNNQIEKNYNKPYIITSLGVKVLDYISMIE